MGGCCAAEENSGRPAAEPMSLEKKGGKSGAMMGSKPVVQDRKTMYADRPKIILGYWKIRGLAQQIRYLLEYIEHPYEEVLFEQGDAPSFSIESWTSVKDTLGLDFPNVPYLIDGDVKLTDPLSIMIYLCNAYAPELLGSTPEQKAEIDMLHGQLKDIRSALISQCYVGVPREALKNNAITKSANIIKHMQGREYITGSSLTYLDFIFLELFEFIDFASEHSFLKQTDDVREYVGRIRSLP